MAHWATPDPLDANPVMRSISGVGLLSTSPTGTTVGAWMLRVECDSTRDDQESHGLEPPRSIGTIHGEVRSVMTSYGWYLRPRHSRDLRCPEETLFLLVGASRVGEEQLVYSDVVVPRILGFRWRSRPMQ